MSSKKTWVEVFDLENPESGELEKLAKGENGQTPIYIIRKEVWVIVSNRPITKKTITSVLH